MAKEDYATEGDFMYALQMKTKALEKDYDVTAGALFAISIDLRCKHNKDPPLDLKDYCDKHGDVCPNDADYYCFLRGTVAGRVFFELLRPAGGRFRDEDEVINKTCMRYDVVLIDAAARLAGGVVAGWEDVTDDEDEEDDE